jgi:hypothetical protein
MQDAFPVVDAGNGIALVVGQEAGVYAVHIISNEDISSVMLNAQLILVRDYKVERGRYHRMVTPEDWKELGHLLYYNTFPVDAVRRQMLRDEARYVRSWLRIVSGSHGYKDYD